MTVKKTSDIREEYDTRPPVLFVEWLDVLLFLILVGVLLWAVLR